MAQAERIYDVFLFDRLAGSWWAAAVVALCLSVWVVRRLQPEDVRRAQRRWRRQLRRRRALARRRRAAAVERRQQAARAARDRRHPSRHMRRRRKIRARLWPAAPITEVDLHEPAVDRIEPEIDLTEPGIEIDLRDRVVYGSEVTLESGDTLESGIVGPFPAD